MSHNFTIEDLARDVAFEIHLGGDRFGPDDVAEWLKGISKEDLEIFRSRVMYHSMDFAPNEPLYVNFAKRSLDMWLSGIETSGPSNGKQESWYKNLPLHEDRGKYLVFDDGNIRLCDKATAEAAWGKEVRRHIISEMKELDVCRHNLDSLLSSYGHNRNGEIRTDFITNCSLPEGHVMAAYKETGKNISGLLIDTGDYSDENYVGPLKVDLDTLYKEHPTLVRDVINYELDERIYRDIFISEQKRQDVVDFKTKADLLIEAEGERVSADFLYDQVLLEKNQTGKVYIRRDVDDLSDVGKNYYIYVVPTSGGGSSFSRVSENFDAGVLSRLSSRLDERLSSLSTAGEFEVTQGRIRLKNGPLVSVPDAFDEEGPLKMKVTSVYYSVEGELMVDGVVQSSYSNYHNSYPLMMLSDKAVESLRKATDAALGLFTHKQPHPELARVHSEKTKPTLKRNGGIEL